MWGVDVHALCLCRLLTVVFRGRAGGVWSVSGHVVHNPASGEFHRVEGHGLECGPGPAGGPLGLHAEGPDAWHYSCLSVSPALEGPVAEVLSRDSQFSNELSCHSRIGDEGVVYPGCLHEDCHDEEVPLPRDVRAPACLELDNSPDMEVKPLGHVFA